MGNNTPNLLQMKKVYSPQHVDLLTNLSQYHQLSLKLS